MKIFKQFSIIVFIVATASCNMTESRKDLPNVTSGEIVRIDSFPSKYVSSRNIDIWIPEDYSQRKTYSVLYMHDAQMLYDATMTWNNQDWGVDEVVSKLMKEGLIKETIVVGIWNSGSERHSDYFPQKPFESLDQNFQDSLLQYGKRYSSTVLFASGVQSDNYLKFIVEELKPIIDKRFNTLEDRNNTFICGSSMGGLISMYAICEYPEIFGAAACMSTHWIGTFTDENNPIPSAFVSYLSENAPDPSTHKIYFDYGTETLDRFYEPYQIEVDSVMKERGYNNSNFLSMKFEGADHSETAWKNRLDIPLKFILAK